ncbi:MAG: putative lipid II flippase FtsW [Parcubacteria group bacterium CG23_combo_of_CG06-09_8_20_14_all_35_9]|nr:MAG: putative lipid II flippase FtsW [Parcubacteria group bacterium CG23_combo_of_CG06-09_8_20_14_all_35_9]
MKTHKPDYVLIIVVGILAVFGFVMLSSVSTPQAYQKFGDSYYYLKRQFFYGLLPGLAALLILSRTDYRKWKKFALLFVIFSLGLLVAVFIPGLSFAHGGARRWINLGGFIFQPAEIVKLTLLIYLACWVEKRGEEIKNFTYGFLPFVALFAIVELLIVLQPNISTMLIVGFIFFIIYFIAGGKILHLLGLGFAGIVFLGILIKMAPYRLARFTTFLNPEIDPQGVGYHINQALLAIGSGGLFGLGLGNSRQKHLYLPEVIGDSIFAIIAEELGFIIVVALIGLFFVLLLRGLKIAKGTSQTFGKLLAYGISFWITFQAFVNIASMIGLLPLTGLTLPFVSYGSSSLVVTFAAMGILINISRQTEGKS